jgi:nucleotide-binding universal stress UspA family protein
LAGAGAMAMATEAAWRDMARLQDDLSVSRLLQGVDTSFVVSTGCVSEDLQSVVRRENIDLIVVGTHGRRGMSRFFVGSVAEQVFRSSSCPVLTVGPRMAGERHDESAAPERPVLFATDFGRASLKALPRAISLANQLGKTLTLLHVLPAVPEPEDPWFTAMDVIKLCGRLQTATTAKLARLIPPAALKQEPAYMVEFGEPSEGIVRAATVLHAGLIVLGLNQKTHIETASHLSWSSAYEVVCAVQCPILTLRNN